MVIKHYKSGLEFESYVTILCHIYIHPLRFLVCNMINQDTKTGCHPKYVNCLFGVLHRFQQCTGHITTSSWKGRGNQYIQFVRVLYCKLPTNGKQLPAFPFEVVQGSNPASEVGGESVTTLPPWPLSMCIENNILHLQE